MECKTLPRARWPYVGHWLEPACLSAASNEEMRCALCRSLTLYGCVLRDGKSICTYKPCPLSQRSAEYVEYGRGGD
ncbi:hypothetical protein NDU88_002225 [Pleurodeles waltl]|uniref:Uncharacterized protein n=1 Tax=Pleurodeles waltl TaxID=8319 RepID=A0AAV7UCK4_PLEWA|nr:hypothetical protein NDU88_002225 [Pleurodeles waltl]